MDKIMKLIQTAEIRTLAGMVGCHLHLTLHYSDDQHISYLVCSLCVFQNV